MKTGRNALCACGSKKKYKKCCGHVAGPERPHVKSMAAVSSVQRQCGDCAACCLGWVTTRVLDQDIHLGKPCRFTDGHGCTIHQQRPAEPCKNFFCGWVEKGSALPEWMQPNRCHVIVITGRISWHGRPVDILVSAGEDPDEKLLTWYRQYSITNLRPFVYQVNTRWYAFGPHAFQLEMAAKVARGVSLWDGDLTAAGPHSSDKSGVRIDAGAR